MNKTITNKEKEWKNIIVILCLFSSQLFFSVTTIFGYQYEGIDSSNVYAIYIVVIMFAALLLSISTLIRAKYCFNYAEIIVLFLPFVFFAEMCLRVLVYGEIMSSLHYFSFFCLWSVPAIYVAVYVKKTNTFSSLIKWFEVVEWILTIAVIITFLIPYLLGDSYLIYLKEANINYQSAAYMGSFAYGLNLYFLFYGKDNKRFRIVSAKIYLFISWFLLLVQILCVFIAGGRGGAVLVVEYTMFFLVISIINKKSKRKFKGIALLISIVLILICILPILLQNNNFYASFSRAFAFIGEKGINWGGTSGRDVVYRVAIERIMRNPVTGYGIFYSLGNFGYPHNFFLELFLEGGIVFCVLGTILFLSILLKIFLICWEKKDPFLAIIFLYPITMLMFSGTYIQTGLFWFVSCFVVISNSTDNLRKLYI